MNKDDWKNKLLCSFLGCKLNRFWFDLEDEIAMAGPTHIQKYGRIRQCSRCGYAEHHNRVKKGFWPFKCA